MHQLLHPPTALWPSTSSSLLLLHVARATHASSMPTLLQRSRPTDRPPAQRSVAVEQTTARPCLQTCYSTRPHQPLHAACMPSLHAKTSWPTVSPTSLHALPSKLLSRSRPGNLPLARNGPSTCVAPSINRRPSCFSLIHALVLSPDGLYARSLCCALFPAL